MTAKLFVIHAAGNARIGVGHLSRCQSVATELQNRHAGSVVLIAQATRALATGFSVKGARQIVAPTKARSIVARNALMRSRPGFRHALISDLLGLTRNDSRQARSHGFDRLIHLNDTVGSYQPDLVLNGDAFLVHEGRDRRGFDYFSGPQYHVVRPRVTSARPARPWNKERVHKVLVTLGGADPGGITELIVRQAFQTRGDLRYTVVIGPAFSPARRRRLLAMSAPTVSVQESVSDVTEAIMAHDLLLSLGGLTSYEGMCLGRPVAAVEWGSMAGYVQRLAGMGLLVDLGDGRDAIQRICDLNRTPHAFSGLADRGWHAIDGRGVRRVVDLILRYSDIPASCP